MDKINNKEVKLVYCPMKKILAAYQSKSIQGKLFINNRKMIIGEQSNDFDCYKRIYVKVFKHYELYVDKDDMFDI